MLLFKSITEKSGFIIVLLVVLGVDEADLGAVWPPNFGEQFFATTVALRTVQYLIVVRAHPFLKVVEDDQG